MRRAIISIILILSLLGVASNFVSAPLYDSLNSGFVPSPIDAGTSSEVMMSGSNVPADQFMERLFSTQSLAISNSFALPGTHEYYLDLSSYLIDGWTLDEVRIDSINMTGIEEREVVGSIRIPPTIDEFAIYEHSANLYYDQLAQGFYNMGHDGQLQNVSLLYITPSYDPPNQNYAYIDIRSDYTDGSTNMVSSVQLNYVGYTPTWANVTEKIILDASTTYYAIMNGTDLIENMFNAYPKIRWVYQDGYGSFLTRRHNTDGPSWGSDRPYEAIMNYTYIPWNKTSNAALQYSDPTAINLMINSVPLSGSSWNINSGTNITGLTFSSDQSVELYYNLTLHYSHSIVGSTGWKSSVSGGDISWNVTTSLTYPAVSNVVSRFMNITNVPIDWSPTGLYLGSSPDGSYSDLGSTITCTSLNDGLWTLTSIAPNYMTDLALSDSSDNSTISYKVANTVDIGINATISMDGGFANLSILKAGSLVYSPPEIPASGGSAIFLWNIDSTTTENGTHAVEVYWVSTDGLEAGYYTQEVFVYHSTTLIADEYSISAYTDDSFNIGINFNSIWPANGLDSPAIVTYSLEPYITNDTMNNVGGGRWTKNVNTTGILSGSYILTVYAEGYALENQSLTINVDLTVATEPLDINWNPSNTISYFQSTNLTVSYRDNNSNPITNAWVNVTFDGLTFNLTYDGISEFYWIQLNGTDFATVPGPTTLTISAWSAGYTPQSNDTTITINDESSGISLSVTWYPSNRTISYINTITITASYTYNSMPINDTTKEVWVRVSFVGYPYANMTYNSGTQLWEVTLNGTDYFGVTSVTIWASAKGLSPESNGPVDLIVIEDSPILLDSWTSSALSIDYSETALLQIIVTDSSGSPILDATLTLNVFGTDYPMTHIGGGVYEYEIDPLETRGVHVVNVTMVRTGYQITSRLLDLTVRATTDIDVDYLSSEYQQWNLTITVTYTDTFYDTPISDGSVIVTINGVEYELEYANGVYERIIFLNFDPGTYTFTVVATGPDCNDASQTSAFEVIAKSAVFITLTTEGDPSLAGQRLEIIATLRFNGTEIAVQNEIIIFTVIIYFANGTVEMLDNPAIQRDRTNDAGVASWGFDIPSGNIEYIWILAEYEGSRINWDADLTQEVRVGTNPILLLLSFFFVNQIGQMIVVSMIVLGVVATAYNKKVKPKKRLARLSLENQLQMFRDLESLRHFMAVYLDRGTCVFYHPFTEERIQPDLISGFIAAITSVYGEIKGDGVRGTLEEIQYHGLRLNSYSGEFIIGILILEGEMTPLLKERLQFFVELFENQYDNELSDWNGLIDCFDREWVVSTLTSAYNYTWLLPHRFGPTQKVGKIDARILDYIAAVRDDKNEFYFNSLLAPLAEMLEISEAEVLDRLLSLEDRGVIIPVSIQTILQRQGMGLANGEFMSEISQSEIPGEDEEEQEPETSEETLEWEEDETQEPIEEEPQKDVDPMEEFVKDVEDLLTKEKEKDSEED